MKWTRRDENELRSVGAEDQTVWRMTETLRDASMSNIHKRAESARFKACSTGRPDFDNKTAS
jgi:hypothetical protein